MAGMFLRQAAGRKVYRNGSHAPTRGTVNPKGYIKRELRKRPSMRRSGLAGAALRRIKRPSSKHPHMGHKPGMHMPKPIRKPPKPRRDPAHPPYGGHPKPPPVPKPPKPPPPAPANPYVQINSNGQLDLPYNNKYGWEVLDNTQQMNQQLRDLQASQQQQANEYASSGRELDQQFALDKRGTLNAAAGRGLAYSSAYGVQSGRVATGYNNARTDLDTQNNAFQQNTQVNRMGIQNAFNEMLRRSGLLQAQASAANAGSLGYGKGTPKPLKVPKYKPPKLHGPKVPPRHPKHGKGGKGGKAHGKKWYAKHPHAKHPKKKHNPIRRDPKHPKYGHAARRRIGRK